MDASQVSSPPVGCHGHSPRVPAKHSDVGLHPSQSRHLVQQPPVAAHLAGPFRKKRAFHFPVILPLGLHDPAAVEARRTVPWGEPGLLSTQIGLRSQIQCGRGVSTGSGSEPPRRGLRLPSQETLDVSLHLSGPQLSPPRPGGCSDQRQLTARPPVSWHVRLSR